MLTPDKIKEKSFQTTGRGSYRAEDVDNFLSEVSASYEQMFKENGDLIKKISVLVKKIEEYRADEESLKTALFNAQKLADKIVAEARDNAENETATVKAECEKMVADAKAKADEYLSVLNVEKDEIISDAKAEAEKIIADANAQGKEILGNINRKATHESLVYEMIQKEASEFKSKLVAMYKEHISLINQLPEIAEEQIEEAEENAEVSVEETSVEETADEFVVIEEAEEIEAVTETEEPVAEILEQEETVEEIEETTEESFEVVEDVASEISEVPAEEPVVKKAFKLDLSKIDFADDIDGEPKVVEDIGESSFEEITEETEEAEEKSQSISFKNFFKKK